MTLLTQIENIIKANKDGHGYLPDYAVEKAARQALERVRRIMPKKRKIKREGKSQYYTAQDWFDSGRNSYRQEILKAVEEK